jgi:hypothetical protein
MLEVLSIRGSPGLFDKRNPLWDQGSRSCIQKHKGGVLVSRAPTDSSSSQTPVPEAAQSIKKLGTTGNPQQKNLSVLPHMTGSLVQAGWQLFRALAR